MGGQERDNPANGLARSNRQHLRPRGTAGITGYAATALGDIVFVGAPAPGETVTAGLACGEVESTKSVSDLLPESLLDAAAYAALTGEDLAASGSLH